ncbi:MAG: CinA family protein [Anaerolineaceae bacterium]|nr:CinA family protein [Anaerolineaceae bacterium]
MGCEQKLLKEISALLREKRLFIATAESCTGGLLGHLITNLPGSSDYYLGGYITYSNYAKQLWLHVPAKIIAISGAVSKETVIVMAYGIRQAFKGKVSPEKIIGFSISGIAGPSGGTPNKPVGTVWMALSAAAFERAYHFKFDGSRAEIKSQSAIKALEILSKEIIKI